MATLLRVFWKATRRLTRALRAQFKARHSSHHLLCVNPPINHVVGIQARGLKSELLNGRLAQIGLFSLLSASAIPGSVPPLGAISGFPQYSGEIMAPFSHDFTMM